MSSCNELDSGIHDAPYHYSILAIVSGLCYGISLTFFLQALCILCSKFCSSKAYRCLLAVNILLFLSATLCFFARISWSISTLQSSLQMVPPHPLMTETLLMPENMGTLPFHIHPFAERIIYILSYGTIAWRAYLACGPSFRGRIFLIGTVVCNAALGVVASTFQILAYDDMIPSVLSSRLSTASYILSVLVNLVATTFITIKVRKIRRYGRIMYNQTEHKMATPLLAMLVLLTDGGILFCVLQFVIVIMNLAFDREKNHYPELIHHPGSAIFSVIALGYATIYPSIVVILTAKQWSLVDIYLSQTVHDDMDDAEKNLRVLREEDLSTIRFASVRTSICSSDLAGDSDEKKDGISPIKNE